MESEISSPLSSTVQEAELTWNHGKTREKRLLLALDRSGVGTWALNLASAEVDCDPRMLEMLGLNPYEGPVGYRALARHIHPQDRVALQDAVREALHPEYSHDFIASFRVLRHDGGYTWISLNGQAEFAVKNGVLKPLGAIGTARDSTLERQNESLLIAQKRLSERIARGDSLDEILQSIVEVVEDQSRSKAVASLMLLDPETQRLHHQAATSLPEDYLRKIDGIPIDALVGTCAAAAALNEVVITPDFLTDPKWASLCHLPLELGLVGAWSMPIRGSDGSVLGTLGTYFREVREPDEREMQIAALLAETAMLAIETRRDRERLDALTREVIERESLYEAVVSITPDLVFVFGLDRRFKFANPALLKLWGKTWQEAKGRTFEELDYPQWLCEQHDREMDTLLSTRAPVKGEVPFDGSEGTRILEYIWSPVFDAHGDITSIAGTARDVTDRKRGEERNTFLASLSRKMAALTTEDEVIQTAIEATGSFLGTQRCYFVECDDDENVLFVGRNWLRDPGISSLEGEYPLHDYGGREWWQSYAYGDFAVNDVRTHPLTMDYISRYDAIGVRSYLVQPFKGDGRRRVVLGLTENVPRQWTPFELGLVEGVVARTWPLVERIRAEASLRESEEHLRLIADHAPALISYMDRRCHYQFVNDHYVQWFGIQREEMLGKHAREVLGEEVFAQRQPYIERVLAGESLRMEGSAHSQHLGNRDLEISMVPYLNAKGEALGFFVMGFDVTDHQQARRSLTERGERLRLLWESARILLTTDDPETMLKTFFLGISGTFGAEVCFNYVIDEADGSLRLLSCYGVADEDLPSIERLIPGEGLCGQIVGVQAPVAVPGTVNGMHRDEAGCFGLKAYAGYPLIHNGRIFGTLSFASRSRPAFSADELEFLETVSHYVTAAYIRLELVATLREADRRKDEFLATLAHELRNPLAPIRTGVEVLKQVSGDRVAADSVIGIIERQTRQMSRLIDDLIDVSRITRGTMELRLATVDLMQVLSDAVEAVKPLIDQQGHHFEGPAGHDAILIHGDAGRLSQVFSNLLGNAARYTPPGGSIRIAVETGPDRVAITVIDNGVGIEREMQETIFEMFAQVRSSPGQSTDGGLGIGLTLVRRLVELHGGSIRVTSKGRGTGSAFRVELPRLVETQPASAECTEQEPIPSTVPPCRILVVDDSVSAADMLRMLFELEGYEAAAAYNGEGALEVAAGLQPQIIFIDLGMPGMDGIETARHLREAPGGQALTLIALTGWGQESDIKRTRDAGFDHHWVKPVDPVELLAFIRRLDC